MDSSGMSADREEYGREQDSYLERQGYRSESYVSTGSRGTVDHVLRPPIDFIGAERLRSRAFEDSAERSGSGPATMASQEGMDASFLSNTAGNGPRISERRNDGQATDQSNETADTGKQHSARGRSRKQDQDQESQVSFHVNPNFGDEEVSDSDVLVNAHASHNAGTQQHYPHSGQPATVMEDEAMLSPNARAPNSPGSSRFPLPEEALSPGGTSGYTDRTGMDHSRAYRNSRRFPPGHSVDGRAESYLQSPNASVAATAELSMLIERAKQLLATTDSRSGEMHRLLGGSYAGSYAGGARSEIGAPTPLHPVRENDAMDEEELLQMRLEAKDDLKTAYAMLNDRYAAPAEKAMSLDELSELEGSGGAAKKNTSSLKGSVAASDAGPAYSTVRAAKLLTTSEHKEQRESERRAKKMIRIKLFPMLLYCFFILACGFYAYVRVIYGMGGLVTGLQVYSYIVLVIELLGALNMVFYGCWLFAKPVNDDVFPRIDASTGKEAPFRRQYNIRVLIPCYKESLAIIQRTVLAAKRADRPPGTRMIIYVCDDGADEKKVAWVQRIEDPEVVYVTGRDKSQKQLNGKSANLNFCLQQIYPDEKDPEMPNELKKIPVNELMCLFDADQTCSRGFFMTMLRYIDSGDDVGVALSPQLMYNVIPDCDVFNHQNVHFWEMMQPGMDALGFISLTGTNMILRSRALQQAGWFPMNSVTEDWALGMRFKKLGYRCRYVNQYLAIGEAPDVTQQAFQQRSRWSKGHFQVFWSRECPLFDGRLNLFYRLAYSSTCVSYLSTGLSVIVLNLVPVLTILFGWFPIALNFYTVVGITAYFAALNALSYYCLSWSHYKALWLANNSSVILFWPYLKASIFTPVKAMLGRTMVFKTTLKGAAAQSASLKVLWPAMLIALINIVSLILGIVNFRASVNAAQGISLCWLVFNTIPHLNLLFYSAFGPGGFMVGWCRFGMFVTTATSALAIVLMWLLYPREVDFRQPLVASIRFLQAERSGQLPQNYTIGWRADSGMQYLKAEVDGTEGVVSKYRKQYTLPPFNKSRDLSGGFYEDGPYGPVKLTKTNALSTALTAWALLDLPDPFVEEESDDGTTLMDDALDIVKHGLHYLLQCFIQDPTKYVNAQGDIYVYQVGNIDQESSRWFRPEDVKTKEQILYTGGIAAPIDLTGQMTAGIVSATMVLHQHGLLKNKEVKSNLAIAERLYNVTMDIKGVLEHDRKLWHSDSFYDDRLWAASWMYRAAAAQYLPLEKASVYYADMVESHAEARIEEDTFVVDQDYVLNMGVVHAAVNTFNWDFHAPAQSFIWDWICSGKVEYSTFGRAWAFDSPYLGDTALAAAMAQIYSIRMRGWDLFPKKFERGFQCFAQQQARYIVGTGWQRKSFIVGVAEDRGYNRITHHGASCPPWPQKCPQNMAASDQPDANVILGGLIWAPEFDDSPKNTRGGNATAVSLGNNVAVPALFAGLLGKTNSWLECLQSNGVLLQHPVCSRGRPSPLENNGELTRSAFWGRVFDVRGDEDDLSDSLTDAFPLTRNLGALPRFLLNPQYYENDLTSLAGNAWQFFDAQRSGKLTPDNRIAWRGDSSLFDGDQHAPQLDLTGGWYDAGGSIKASMPFCSSVWRLAWNLISYRKTYNTLQFQRNKLLTDGKRHLLWAAAYLQRIHYNETNLIAFVGDANADENILPTEALMPEQYATSKQFARPVVEINKTTGGSDLIAEAVAAFASVALLFREETGSEDFSNAMTKHARQLYEWMKTTPGTMYSEVHPMLARTYPSQVPHAHMMLAAAWMYRLTNELKFETDAASFHSRAREQAINPVVGWRNPLQEAKILLLEGNPNSEGTWLPGLTEWTDAQMFGDDVQYSRKGLWQTPRQDATAGGALANAASVANVALRTAAIVDSLATAEDEAWMVVWAFHARCLARQQMNYIMGGSGRSYVTGWGVQPPQRPHHRGASCAFVTNGTQCSGQQWANPKLKFANTLPGALIGGPNLYDEFNDNHLEEIQSRVSVDSNAALLSGVSSMLDLPAHFWLNTNFCPVFPIAKVKWTTAQYKPVPGVVLPDTPEDGSVIL